MFKVKSASGNGKVYAQINNLTKLTKQGIRSAYYESGAQLVKSSKKMINHKPKHGIVYSVTVRGVTRLHTASAPGEAPANLTGALKGALDFVVSGADQLEFGVRQYSPNSKSGGGVTYGKTLEEGVGDMSARPYLGPAIEENYGNIQVNFEQEIEKAIKEDE